MVQVHIGSASEQTKRDKSLTYVSYRINGLERVTVEDKIFLGKVRKDRGCLYALLIAVEEVNKYDTAGKPLHIITSSQILLNEIKPYLTGLAVSRIRRNRRKKQGDQVEQYITREDLNRINTIFKQFDQIYVTLIPKEDNMENIRAYEELDKKVLKERYRNSQNTRVGTDVISGRYALKMK